MRTIFADTFVWLALVNTRDLAHDHARELLEDYEGRIVTTEAVLLEVADALAANAAGRAEFASLESDLRTDPGVEIIPLTASLFRKAVELYIARPDKQWSLTDCMSFVVMEERGLAEAATGDHHFEQAGFVALLK